MPQVKPEIETFAKIKVIGVGGSGGSAVDRMVQSGIRGVDFWVMNTDVQALHHNAAPHKLHIGKTVTRGLGAGMDPEMGKRSAEEAQNEIREALKDTDMVFVTCGLGGGTGSGASPVIAEIAREMGALTVGVVTRPFGFEGPQRKKIADGAFNALSKHVDTIITIPNDRVLQIIDKKTSLLDAFKMVDEVLHQGVQGISELITIPGEINVDFADVKSIMSGTGSALMGIGTASGENRAAEAAKAAISSPLLELSIDGARGILFTITGGADLGMLEVQEAANIITSSADENAKTIFGTVIDESMGDEIRITVIATGFDDPDVSIAPLSFNSTSSKEEARHEPLSAPKRAIFNAPKFSWQERGGSPQDMEEEKEADTEEESPQTPAPAKPMFTSKQVDTSEESTAPKPVAQQRPAPKKVTKPEPDTDTEEVDQNDLEIPAFIRRKMGL